MYAYLLIFTQCISHVEGLLVTVRLRFSHLKWMSGPSFSTESLRTFCLSPDRYAETNVYSEQKRQRGVTCAVYQSHPWAVVFTLWAQATRIRKEHRNWKKGTRPLVCGFSEINSPPIVQLCFSAPWISGPICLLDSLHFKQLPDEYSCFTAKSSRKIRSLEPYQYSLSFELLCSSIDPLLYVLCALCSCYISSNQMLLLFTG